MAIKSTLATVYTLCFFAALSLDAAPRALAATYYVGPKGANMLSTGYRSPGSLAYAFANAPGGSTVILENGVYDGAPAGFTVEVSHVTFRAQHWHGAIVENTTGAILIEPASQKVVDDTCQGIVFGPCVKPTFSGWSGGGGDGWRFLDCLFRENDGVGFGSNSFVERCVFTDNWFNSFDVNEATGFVMRNCIARRGNRANGDSDSIGNKEDLADNLTFDGLIDYDNEGPGLWFDTNNKNWVVKNCTFFANHGGANWYMLIVAGGAGNAQFTGNGQDGAGVSTGAKIMAVEGTKANLGFRTVVTAVKGYNPMTITVSPALPAPPAAGDGFAVQQGGNADSGGVGLMSEANPNGAFIDNVTYNNTDSGFLDADSGDGYGVAKPGLTITGNRFYYDGITFRAIDGGKGDPTRKLGPAVVERNKFRVGAMTGQYAFHPGGTNWLQGFPKPYYHLNFDYNIYEPDPGYKGAWAAWYIWSGGPSKNYSATGLSELRDAATFDQDQHSAVGKVALRGRTVRSYTWPGANDTDWSDIYFPNNRYSQSSSVHQVDDDETPYIQNALDRAKPGKTIPLTVFGHTRILGNGPFTCEVYDYSGRWLLLDLPRKSDAESLDARVPGYAVLTPSHVEITFTSTDPYSARATYTVPPSGGSRDATKTHRRRIDGRG